MANEVLRYVYTFSSNKEEETMKQAELAKIMQNTMIRMRNLSN